MPFDSDENPWSAWVSQHFPGTFAHPDAPAGGTGLGYGRRPGPSGTDFSSGRAPDPYSPAGRVITPWEAAAEYAKFELDRARGKIRGAMTWDALRSVALRALGPQCFSLGVYHGMVKNPAMSVAGLLQLQKMLIEADLYERLTHRISWKTLLSPGCVTGLPQLYEVGFHLARYAGVISVDDLKRSYEAREALIKNVEEMIEHPVDSLGKMGTQMKASYLAKWKRFRELQKQTDLKSQFEAGEIFGDVLMEVVMLVLTVISVAGAAAKLAAKVPQLVRVAEFIRGARAAEVSGAAAEAGEAATEAKSAAKAVEAAPKEEVEAPRAEAPVAKTPVAEDLYKIDANGTKAVQIRQGTNDKVAVIGRDMDTVRPYAAELKAKGYDVEIFDGDTVPDAARSEWAQIKKSGKWLTEDEIPQTENYKANGVWADKLVRENYTVIDIGSPAGAGPSQFYKLELSKLF